MAPQKRVRPRRPRGGRNTRRGRSVAIPRTLNDGLSYKGQPTYKVWLPGNATLFTTSAAGLGQLAYGIGNFSAGNIQGWASRFENCFDEYRILKCRFDVIPLSANGNGVSNFWFDEKNSSAPTSNETTERIVRRVPNTSNDARSQFSMLWVAKDLLDLQYTQISVDVISAYFKVYTNNALWGTPAVAASYFTIQPVFFVEMRGLRSV